MTADAANWNRTDLNKQISVNQSLRISDRALHSGQSGRKSRNLAENRADDLQDVFGRFCLTDYLSDYLCNYLSDYLCDYLCDYLSDYLSENRSRVRNRTHRARFFASSLRRGRAPAGAATSHPARGPSACRRSDIATSTRAERLQAQRHRNQHAGRAPAGAATSQPACGPSTCRRSDIASSTRAERLQAQRHRIQHGACRFRRTRRLDQLKHSP